MSRPARIALGDVALACAVAAMAMLAVFGPDGPAMTIALYTVAANRPRRVAVAAVWLLLAANTFALTVSPTTGRDIGLALVSICGAWLVGDDVRMRRAYAAEVEARLAAVQRERTVETERAVAGERTRIARELHDIIAHHVSGITVRAAAAAERMPSGDGRDALEAIEDTGRQTLAELRSLLGVLSAENDQAGRRPQPGLDDVPEMVRRFGGDGIVVEMVVE